MTRWLLVVSLIFVLGPARSQDLNKDVFNANRGGNRKWLSYQSNHEALYRIISNEAFQLLDKRETAVAGLKTASDWQAHQEKVKSILGAGLSGFEKTPLNPKITGILEREKFTVEKILFESQPGFFVTACLFLPRERQNPAPAIIYCSGHTELGFRSETYQRVMLNLVDKGFIVFAFDPLGQGERLQYPDPATGKSKVGGSTKEHSYAGVQILLSGTSLSDYFIWDGIRAVDYLATRREVDMNRIGITGRSGGGTQSAMIAACDDRIYAAAPENYITSFRRLLQSIGPQDAEQNPWHAIRQGFDHPDFLHARAPKPTLIITTTHDFFSLQGARETFKEVRKSYTTFGKTENLTMTEDLGGHESTRNNREALYGFFRKHLDLPGDTEDKDIVPFTLTELQVTTTGQAGTSLQAETVFSLNRKYFSLNKLTDEELRKKVPEIAGMDLSRKLKAAVQTGKIRHNGLEIRKYFLETDSSDYAIPLYVYGKEDISINKTILWVHPSGKASLPEDSLANILAEAGYTLVSADLPGIGELSDPDFTGDGIIENVPFNYTFGANLVGKSIPGIQAEAIDVVMQFLENDDQFSKGDLYAVALETASAALLHCVTVRNPVKKIVLADLPEPAINLINQPFYNPGKAYFVAPGSIPYYNLNDLAGLLPTQPLQITRTKISSAKKYSEMIVDFFEQ
jgi:hypothetical protein